MRVLAGVLAVMLGAATAVHGNGPSALPRTTPETQGIRSAAIQAFLVEAEQKIDALHSVMIVRHGAVVAEGWWAPYAAAEPHMMFSLSKSFTSTAVGLAVSEGRLSIDDPVLKFFPDEAPAEPSANLKAMRVRDLLTMTAGHHDEDIQKFPYRSEDSVVGKFLSLPVAHKPGTFFVYNTPASYMLSAIVQKVTGQTVLDYLGPRLFKPLGIEGATWEASRQGVSMGGFGLSVRTEDIARFGELFLRKGAWQGRQLVPAAWVDAATSRQVGNGSSPSSDWEQGYGYQFWRSRHGFYRGDGAHGQFCLVLPQHDTVIAITAGTRDMGAVMNLVWDRLVPALDKAPLPANPADEAALRSKLASLTLAPVAGAPTSPTASAISGRRYAMADAKAGLEAVTLTKSEATTVTLRLSGQDQDLVVTPGAWHRTMTPTADGLEPVAASGAWADPETYLLKVVRYRTPFVTSYRLRFAGDEVTGEVAQNVGPPDQRTVAIHGRAAATPAPSAQSR
jgi:CubicO group peptidase (beta-lactamase class C family)